MRGKVFGKQFPPRSHVSEWCFRKFLWLLPILIATRSRLRRWVRQEVESEIALMRVTRSASEWIRQEVESMCATESGSEIASRSWKWDCVDERNKRSARESDRKSKWDCVDDCDRKTKCDCFDECDPDEWEKKIASMSASRSWKWDCLDECDPDEWDKKWKWDCLDEYVKEMQVHECDSTPDYLRSCEY